MYRLYGDDLPCGLALRRLSRLMLTLRFSFLYGRRREASDDRRQPQPAGRYRSDPAPARSFLATARLRCATSGGPTSMKRYLISAVLSSTSTI